MDILHYITKNSTETKTLGKKIAGSLTGKKALCLYGPLGSGKTTFVSGLIDFFLPGQRILSPTFVIVRHYQTGNKKIKNIIHADLYRLSKGKHIKELGLDDFFNQPDCIVLIEWADRLSDNLPKKRKDIIFEIIDESSRKIIIKNYD